MEYLSTNEVRSITGWTRQFVSFVAIRENWQKLPGSRPRHYLASDVQDYLKSREHTNLARRMGLVFRGMIRHHNGYSLECPICNSDLTNN